MVLVYRVPREPSSPRIAIWRRIRALGVAQLGDGIVALPADARTREQLEWVADQVLEADGIALLLRAETLTAVDERDLARSMSVARAEEYRTIEIAATEALGAPPVERRRALKRLRRDMRAVQRRDYFPPAERDAARAALTGLADRVRADDATSATKTASAATPAGGEWS